MEHGAGNINYDFVFNLIFNTNPGEVVEDINYLFQIEEINRVNNLSPLTNIHQILKSGISVLKCRKT